MCPIVTVNIPRPHILPTWSDALATEAKQTLPPPPINLPSFSHIPPPHITGIDRWPISLDAQAFPMHRCLTLFNILLWVQPFLHTHDITTT
jgi:hypothetical protein